MYESHQDVVSSLPPDAIELAYTNKGNQSFCVDGFLYGVQFHPEFSYDVTRKLMDLRIKRGVEIDDKNLRSNLISNGEKRLNEVKNNDEFDQFFKLVEKYKDQISLYKSID